jgi:hypothetical protein
MVTQALAAFRLRWQPVADNAGRLVVPGPALEAWADNRVRAAPENGLGFRVRVAPGNDLGFMVRVALGHDCGSHAHWKVWPCKCGGSRAHWNVCQECHGSHAHLDISGTAPMHARTRTALKDRVTLARSTGCCSAMR